MFFSEFFPCRSLFDKNWARGTRNFLIRMCGDQVRVTSEPSVSLIPSSLVASAFNLLPKLILSTL